MNTSEIKELVRRFRHEYHITDVTSDVLEEVFTKQGFIIVDYNPVVNDSDVTTVIEGLGLGEMICRSNGFLYVDAKHRLVFVNEKLNSEERMVVLAHEEGHYYCEHMGQIPVVGRTVTEEYEANEFAHYLLKRSLWDKSRAWMTAHRKWILLTAILCLTVLAGLTAYNWYKKQQVYTGDYYITMHGEKYHLKNCVTIEGHPVRRLRKEEIDNYEPCSVCMPEGRD